MKKYFIKMAGLFLLILVSSSFIFISKPGPDIKMLKVHMMNANGGRNDSFIIQLPNDQTMIVDTQMSLDLTYKLKELGITSLDYIVGTHEHVDHIGGLDDILNSGIKYNNDKIYYPNGTENDNSNEYLNMVKAATKRGLTVQKCVQGDVILDTFYNGRKLKILVIAPVGTKVDGQKGDDYTGVNVSSLGLKITYGTKSILMMADIAGPPEYDLLASPYAHELSAQVLKVGHHGLMSGSYLSCSDGFLDKVQPAKALITNGKGHEVNPVIMANLKERKINYWTTNVNGYTWLATDGTRAWTASEEPTWP